MITEQISKQISCIHLSQANLNILEKCPPQFQRLYLDRLSSPISIEEKEKQIWGTRFHLLMQQQQLGLPIGILLAENPDLEKALVSLIAAVKEKDPQILWSDSEHHRSLELLGCLLSVVYDLIIVKEDCLQIIDWKTYRQPNDRLKLEKNWQTRLYLYILAETSDYLPENISMTYWFVKLPDEPTSITFTYNRDRHEQTRQDLVELLTKLNKWSEDYIERDIPFPHLNDCQKTCPYYQDLRRLPQRHQLTPISHIAELPI
jgi:hypothetical protein